MKERRNELNTEWRSPWKFQWNTDHLPRYDLKFISGTNKFYFIHSLRLFHFWSSWRRASFAGGKKRIEHFLMFHLWANFYSKSPPPPLSVCVSVTSRLNFIKRILIESAHFHSWASMLPCARHSATCCAASAHASASECHVLLKEEGVKRWVPFYGPSRAKCRV